MAFSIPSYHAWFRDELISKFSETLIQRMWITNEDLVETIDAVIKWVSENNDDDTNNIQKPWWSYEFIKRFLENTDYTLQEIQNNDEIFTKLVDYSIITKDPQFKTWPYALSDDDILTLYTSNNHWLSLSNTINEVYSTLRKSKMYDKKQFFATCPAHPITIESILKRDVLTYKEE